MAQVTDCRQERLAELVALIRDANDSCQSETLTVAEAAEDAMLSRRQLWQAEAVFAGQMTDGH